MFSLYKRSRWYISNTYIFLRQLSESIGLICTSHQHTFSRPAFRPALLWLAGCDSVFLLSPVFVSDMQGTHFCRSPLMSPILCQYNVIPWRTVFNPDLPGTYFITYRAVVKSEPHTKLNRVSLLHPRKRILSFDRHVLNRTLLDTFIKCITTR